MTTGEVVSAWSKECERSVINKIVEDAIRGYKVNVCASFTERNDIQTSDASGRDGRVNWGTIL